MIGVIGGTGLGEALFGHAEGREFEVETPFGRPSGPLRIVSWNGQEVALLPRHGPGHMLNPGQVPYRANLYALKALGCTHIFASGAVGSLREEIRPRSVVVVDQIIDRTTRRPSTFFDDLAVHVEFAQPCCPDLRKLLLSLAPAVDVEVHPQGVYVCMEGPAFSTAAEARMHRAWGGDVIGMTAIPEARLAREAEMSYALVALVTDYDCWRPHPPGATPQALLQEIMDNLREATASGMALIRAAIDACTRQPLPPSPIHTGLDLAVWSNRSKITPAQAEKYGVLLKRFLQH